MKTIPNNVASEVINTTSKSETATTERPELEKQNECVETTKGVSFTSATNSKIEKTTNAAISEKITEDTADNTGRKNSRIQYYTEQDVIDIAKVLYHECRGVPSKTEQACVAWTILNRVDYHSSTVHSVVRSPNQFAFYENAPVWDELLDLADDVLYRWSREKAGEKNVGRVLPREYIYFEGRNGHNYFRDSYSGSYNIWDYSLESPYES